MYLATQLDRLLDLGLADVAGVDEDDLVSRVSEQSLAQTGVLVVHPDLVPAARLAPLLERHGLPGFVVPDMTDLAAFAPIPEVEVPDTPFYALHDVDRGDDLRDWSPDAALPETLGRGRTPLTISEGISWLLQDPTRLEPNHCFMTIASRKPRKGALDKRTPAIWISGGAERDGGKDRDGAPKVGWCWAGNRHTWLGIASAAHRSPLPASR